MAILTLYSMTSDCSGNDTLFQNTGSSGYIGGGGAGESGFKSWFPFANVTIPKNTNIISATIKLVATFNDSGTTCKIKTGCEATDSATTAPTNWTTLNAKVLTSAYSTNNSVSAFIQGTEYTFDAKAAVQEIINRSGWTLGNTIAVMVNDNAGSTGSGRRVAFKENITYAVPTLVIEYIVSEASSLLSPMWIG